MEKFLLTAVGDNLTPSDTSDDQKAVTTFTDGQLALWAWRNQPGPTENSWDGGTTIQQANSIYAENEVIPFRWTDLAGKGGGQDLIENQTYTIQLDYAYAGGTTYPGKLFFDYLTSYNETESAAAPFGTGSDLTGFQNDALISTIAIPNDGGDTGGTPANPATAPHSAGYFTLYNIASGAFGAYTAQPVNSTQEDRLINFTFTVADDGDSDHSEAQNVGVAWGGHLAAESFYGQGNGAANFPGASPQMVVDLNPAASGDTTNININPNAIVPQGQITIIKDAIPDDAQNFSFTSNIPGFESFTLDDDADGTLSNQFTIFGIPEGTYTITETSTFGWVLDGITYAENGIDDTTTADIGSKVGDSFQVTVADGEVWTATFTNKPAPNLSILLDKSGVVSDVDGNGFFNVNDTITYTFEVSNTGNVPLNDITVIDDAFDLGSLTINPSLSGGFNSGDIDQDNLLDVTETWTYTATHTVDQGDVDYVYTDPLINNSATAYGNPPGGIVGDKTDDVQSTDDEEISVQLVGPELNITKEASVDGGTADAAGEVINYSISVENTGGITLTGIVVTDPYADAGSITYLSGDTNTDGKLDVDETWLYSAAHTITQAEIDSNGGGDGKLENIATADSTESESDSDDAFVPVDYLPSIDVEKYVSVDGKALDDPTKMWEDADSPKLQMQFW